jgi:hypothetical protein
MRAELARALAPADGGWRVLPAAAGDEATADVLAVFGRRVDDVVAPTAGLNELASALVASTQLATALDRRQRIAVAACIEQTIPFRPDPVAPLRDRLLALGLPDGLLDETLARAVRLANHDIENFADDDPARFLDNTWKLLPECNPALHTPILYTVRDYRIALQGMEGFLARLSPDRVFRAWRGEPAPDVHADRRARAAANLALAVRYLRAKLYSIAVIEAVAELSGGDVPLDYFMGGLVTAHHSRAGRMEGYLPEPLPTADLDAALQRLLAAGRASESSFDTASSPVSAFLHAAVGEAAMMHGVEVACRWWAGQIDALAFVDAQPATPVAAIARAAANIMETRRDRLQALARRLES